MNLKKLSIKEQTPAKMGFVYTENKTTNQKGIKCLTCNRTSYNTKDIDELYCGYCNRFHKK